MLINRLTLEVEMQSPARAAQAHQIAPHISENTHAPCPYNSFFDLKGFLVAV